MSTLNGFAKVTATHGHLKPENITGSGSSRGAGKTNRNASATGQEQAAAYRKNWPRKTSLEEKLRDRGNGEPSRQE
jgi:hypothetical protein